MDTKSIRSRTRVSVLTKIEGLKMAAYLQRFRTSFTLPFSLLPNSIAINSTISRLAFSTAYASPRKRVGTHNGTIHCDEALGCFMVSLTSKFHRAQLIRTRNLEVLDSFFSKTLICSTHRHLYHRCRLHNSRLLSAASSSTSETKAVMHDLEYTSRKQALFWFFCKSLLHHFTEEAAYQIKKDRSSCRTNFILTNLLVHPISKILNHGLNKGRNLYEMKTGEMKGLGKVKVQVNWHGLRSGCFENSYIPENPRTPKPLTFSKNRLCEAKNRSNTSPVAKKNSEKTTFFFKNFAYVKKKLHMCTYFCFISKTVKYLKLF
ncbi:hypothetical protein LXL04_030227 [Taraxacum kok-saghyz]